MSKPPINNKIKRFPKREVIDKQQINDIIDQALRCTVSFISENIPYSIPTIHARKDNLLLFHGARGGDFLKQLKSGATICVTITLIDGLVLARSGFNHSMNYRSVIAHGKCFEVEEKKKVEALKMITEQIMPGRWGDIRPPSVKEIEATVIVAMSLDNLSAKTRTGFSNENKSDYDLPVWSGIVPLQIQAQKPEPDTKNKVSKVPDYIINYKNR